MTQAIILAAGKGDRLMPLTSNKPKCCIEFNGISLLQYQLNTFAKANINKVSIVAGYMYKEIEKYGLNTILNDNYASSNMVKSLFFNDNFYNNLDEDLIISYGDIIYEYKNLIKLLSAKTDISIIVDLNWINLWKIRMDNPLNDAESLLINENDQIIEIGQKVTSYSKIQGQYTGLILVKKKKIQEIRKYYLSINNGSLDNLYMTDFIQLLINNGNKVNAVKVKGGWLEFDTVKDLRVYENLLFQNKLGPYFKI